MYDVLSELAIELLLTRLVAQIPNEVLEVKAGAAGRVAVISAVLANDGGGDGVLIPGLETRILHKLVLEGRYQPLKRVSDNEKFKIGL